MKKLLLAGAVLVSASAFAFTWPSSGTATIPAGETAAITDADIANVANLDAIVLSDAASAVTANALSSALTLKANVSGPGTLTFTDCQAGLTLTGDNSALTGKFIFSNTDITSASAHALGGPNTPRCDFALGAAGKFRFAGAGLTNDVPLYLSGGRVTLPYDGTDVLQQGASVTCENGKGLNLRCFAMTNGTFNLGQSYCTCKVLSGGKASFGPAVVMVASLAAVVGESNTIFDFATRNFSSFGLHYHGYSGGNWIRFEGENILPSTWVHKPQINGTSGGFDLNGYNQSINTIRRFDETIVKAGKVCFNVKSVKPATLTLTAADANTLRPIKFLGAASFEFAGSGSYELVNVTSDTTGGLTVSSGTVIMTWDYGWNGTNVLVRSGATLTVDTANAITSGKANFVLETGGTLDTCGNNLAVASATIGGVELEKGDMYSAAWIAAHCPGVTWSGNGSLTVMPEEEEEFEWPTTPGAIAKIPMGKTVTVTDADLSKLAILGGIQVKVLGNLVFDGLTDPYTLAVPLSGYGTVTVEDCARYAITANNTNFLGHFEFTDTTVVVSNRFALGCADSVATEFTNTKFVSDVAVNTFLFMGGGLTNDVPLIVSDRTYLPGAGDETLVQNAGITLLRGTQSHFNARNLTVTRGTVLQGDKDTVLYGSVARGCTFTLGPEARLDFANAHMSGAAPSYYAINSTNVSYTYWTIYEYASGMKFGIKDAFKGRTIETSLDGAGYGLDLGGFDQRLSSLSGSAPTEGSASVLRIPSEKPAVLTLTAGTTMPLRFEGMAGLTFAGTGVNTIVNQCSTSEGNLTVESGTLSFKWASGWAGTNVVVSGGTLQIQSSARQDFFLADDARGRSRVRAAVSGDGTIDLGADIAARVGYLSTNGVELVKGTYGGTDAGLDAAHTLPCLTGAGTLTVQRGRKRGFVLTLR